MLKKIILTILILLGMEVYASDNYLNSVVISNDDGKASIILRTDEITRINKEVESADKIIITLKGITQSPSINTFYKDTSAVSGLIIQNDGNNDIKIYVEAPEISKADIVFETPDSAPLKANTGADKSKLFWGAAVMLLLLIVMRRSTKIDEPDVNEIIKEREKALYQNFQKEVASLPSINYKLKSYRKHVLKGETIRNYASSNARI